MGRFQEKERPSIPDGCRFCGARLAVANGITGIVVFHCLTAWDSQRGDREGLWKQSEQCKQERYDETF